MRILIACEESQAVCKEFRRLGHEAYSCDVQMCTGGETAMAFTMRRARASKNVLGYDYSVSTMYAFGN